MNFYTNFYKEKDYLKIKFIQDGVRKQETLPINYNIYVTDNTNSFEYKSIYNNSLKEMSFDNQKDLTAFIDNYKNSNGFEIHGFNRYEYSEIDKLYPGDDVNFDMKYINIGSFDIETETKGGYAKPHDPFQPINLITISKWNTKERYTLGLGPYDKKLNYGEYIYCRSEQELLEKFINIWTDFDLDIITGWNITGYDIPYIINRINKVLGQQASSYLSPWRKLKKITIKNYGKEQESYEIKGIAILDYLDLYKKYTYSEKESYKLDYIGQTELNLKKVDYSEYGSLQNLSETNWELFVEYNIRDDDIVKGIDNKLKFIELACTLAYLSKCNYEDVFTISRIWDVVIQNYLKLHMKIIVPINGIDSDRDNVEGGYVKIPIKGKHNWVVSFDFTSLYPHIIMGCNISTETILDKSKHVDISVDDIVYNDDKMEKLLPYLKSNNCSLTGIGATFSNESKGFLPILMDRWFNLRNDTKILMLEKEREYEEVMEEIKRRNNV